LGGSVGKEKIQKHTTPETPEQKQHGGLKKKKGNIQPTVEQYNSRTVEQ
jgi:hypothetical protein